VSELSLSETIDLNLHGTGVSPERFAYLVQQLLAQGSIARGDSQAQDRLYDDAVRCQGTLRDYLGCTGFRLVHSDRFTCFRLYPPAPTEGEDAEEMARGLRARPSSAFSAYALVLRDLYQRRLDVGDVADNGDLLLSRAEIEQGLADLLDMAPPTAASLRKETYKTLRAQRLVRLPEGGLEEETEEMLFAIRPLILDYVTEPQLLAARGYMQTRRLPEEERPNAEEAS
jgi:hypothetical protein